MSQSLPTPLSSLDSQSQSHSHAISQFLASFSSRQSLMQAIRGCAITVVALVCGVGVIIAIDWVINVRESLRWSASCIVYGVSFLAGWFFGLKRFFQPPTAEAIAWSVEESTNAFHESLVASVGLQRPNRAINLDSQAFVAAIEQNVAREINGIAMDSILPWGAITKQVLSAISAIALILLACCIPSAKFPERLARAMLPFVSIARPSTVQIAILEPHLTALSVPSDQVLAFAIEITGGSPADAFLEIIESGPNLNSSHNSNAADKRQAVKMSRASEVPLRFAATSPISDRRMSFRFQSGDAETGWRTITPMPRPRAIAFHSEVEPPAYTQMPKETASNPRGDLRVLKGSRVKVDIDVNQPLSDASLELEFTDSGKRETVLLRTEAVTAPIALVPGAKQRYTAEFDIERSATYQVRLVSEFEYQGKHIENTYSPRYRIDSLEDDSPNVGWNANKKAIWGEQSPKANQVFIVAPDELVGLSAVVSDNLPVESFYHEASVNRGPWVTVHEKLTRSSVFANEIADNRSDSSLSKAIPEQSNWTWDLSSLAASSGDSVTTRVSAVDRKGNKASSPVLQFSLAAVGFDRDRHRAMLKRSELVPLLEALSNTLSKPREQLRPRIEKLRDINSPIEERRQTIADLRLLVETSASAARGVLSASEVVIKEIGRCVDQGEVELTVRVVSRIEKEWLASMSYGADQVELAFDTAIHTDAKSAAWHKRELEQSAVRLLQAYDSSFDNARRTMDIYRQFIGLELQSALTSDLTYLRDHQRSSLDRNSTDEFTSLCRSQQIAEHYMDSIANLAFQMGPKLNQDFRNRLPELYRWLDQTRTEMQDLAQQAQSEQATKGLRARIERSVSELQNVRWVFNLQGNLISDVVNCRKELLNRSGSLWQSIERFNDRHTRRVEAGNDKSIDTLELLARNEKLAQEATGPILSAISQMLERRDIHQRRALSDPLYASDMGMAYRAWTSVLERWVLEPAQLTESFADIQSIAKAFRILEAFHETVEARLVVQSLLPIEQYGWKTQEGRLYNPKQWDSVPFRLEVAQQWMREAGFPGGVADKFNGLRWTEPAQNINKKLNPRRDANHENLVSSSEEFRALLVLWAEADLAAKPTLDQARATLVKFSPSVTELAKQASKATQKLEELTKQMNPTKSGEQNERRKENSNKADTPVDELQANNTTKKNEESNSAAIPTQKQIQREREVSESKISQLQDALIEMANKQDLLDKADLDVARDSDHSLKLLDAVVPLMNEALNEAIEATTDSATDKEEKVTEAVKLESRAVAAMNKIADHFALLATQSEDRATNPELEKSRAELNQLMEESIREYAMTPEMMPLADQSENYKRAEQLEDLANSDPDTLLKRLESELTKNPTMQQELSQISKENAQSLSNELKSASQTEDSLAKQLENADAKLVGEKRLKLDELQSAAEQVDRFAARLLDNSERAAQRSGMKTQTPTVQKAAADLRAAAQAARYLNEQTPRNDLESASQKLLERTEEAIKQVEAASQAIEPALNQVVEKDEGRRVNVRNETQKIQTQSRNELLHQAKEHLAQTQRLSDQAKKRVQQSQAELDNLNKQRQAAKGNLDKQPASEPAMDALRQATNRAEQALAKKLGEEKIAVQAEAFHGKAKEKLDAFERDGNANMDKPNPQAALALEQLEKAKAQLDQIEEQVKSTLKSLGQLQQPQPTATTLAAEEREQGKTQEKVFDVARQLERSSRHEERLQNAQGAKKLAAQAQSVAETAKGSVDQAREQLSANAKETEKSERDQYAASLNEELKATFNRPESSSAQAGLNKSSQELAAQSNKIGQLLGEMKGSSQPSSSLDSVPNSTKPSDSDTGPSVLRELKQTQAREMARMLDVLDRQMNSGDNNSEKSAVASSSDKEPNADGSKPQAESKGNDTKPEGASEDRNGARSSFKDSVKNSAEKLSSSMGQERLAQRAESQLQSTSRNQSRGSRPQGNQTRSGRFPTEKSADFTLPGVSQAPNRDWGKLRDQRAEDAVEGQRDDFDPEFNRAIQAYYKALGKP
ncbi:MAG: hypothetical protein NTY15_10185 [Planctomycetota bacterium]|nr:hypothetical protein [Planctomycetota bacterium]